MYSQTSRLVDHKPRTDVAKPTNRTPLWTLKVTQMLLFAANVCLIRFITVYYHDPWQHIDLACVISPAVLMMFFEISVKLGKLFHPTSWHPVKLFFSLLWEKKLSKDLGLSRKLMGILLVLMPTMSFLGGLFWSVIVDRTGSYRGVLTTTSLLGVTTIFGYLLPQAATSFSAVWWYGDGSIVISSCMNLFPGRIIIWVCSEMRYIPPIIDNYSHLIGEWWFTIGFRAMLWDKPIGFCHLGPGIPGLNPINSSVFSQGLPLLVLITLLHGSPGLQPSIFWKCHWMSVSPQRYHWGSSVVSVEEK